MWIFMTKGFLSIIQDKADPNTMVVRARHKDDLCEVFGEDVEVIADAGTDYKFRARIPRERVAEVIAAKVAAIDYTNFKDTVTDPERHDAYFDVWDVMYKYQVRANKKSPD